MWIISNLMCLSVCLYKCKVLTKQKATSQKWLTKHGVCVSYLSLFSLSLALQLSSSFNRFCFVFFLSFLKHFSVDWHFIKVVLKIWKTIQVTEGRGAEYNRAYSLNANLGTLVVWNHFSLDFLGEWLKRIS